MAALVLLLAALAGASHGPRFLDEYMPSEIFEPYTNIYDITPTGIVGPARICYGSQVIFRNLDTTPGVFEHVMDSLSQNVVAQNPGDTGRIQDLLESQGVFDDFTTGVIFSPDYCDDDVICESAPYIFQNPSIFYMHENHAVFVSLTNPAQYRVNITFTNYLTECLSCDRELNGVRRFDTCGDCLDPQSLFFNRACTGCDPLYDLAANNATTYPLIANSTYQPDDCGQCLLLADPQFNSCYSVCGLAPPFNDPLYCTGCGTVPVAEPPMVDDCGVCDGRNKTCAAPADLRIDLTRGEFDLSDLYDGARVCVGDRVTIRLGERDEVIGSEFLHLINLYANFDSIPTASWPRVFANLPVDDFNSVTFDTTDFAAQLGLDFIIDGNSARNYTLTCSLHEEDWLNGFETATFLLLPAADCFDCSGAKGGARELDLCGVCLYPDDPLFNACLGCDGVPFSGWTPDLCGVCLAPADPARDTSCTPCAVPQPGSLDACGDCLPLADPLRDQACLDVCGVPNGFNNTCAVCMLGGQVAAVDACGVCGGDGTACTFQTIAIRVSRNGGLDLSGAAGLYYDDGYPVACAGDTLLFLFDETGAVRSGTRTSQTSTFDSGLLPAGANFTYGLTFADIRPSFAFFSLLTSAGQPLGEAAIGVEQCAGCDGQPRSRARVDQCGVCGGLDACVGCDGVVMSGLAFDSCGVCNGTNACLGCDGLPDSGLVVDSCGVCGGDDACLGCDGVPFSGWSSDGCGVCLAPGDPARNATCSGCDGVPFSGLRVTSCGVCGGSELECRRRSQPGRIAFFVLTLIGALAVGGLLLCLMNYRERDEKEAGRPRRGWPPRVQHRGAPMLPMRMTPDGFRHRGRV